MIGSNYPHTPLAERSPLPTVKTSGLRAPTEPGALEAYDVTCSTCGVVGSYLFPRLAAGYRSQHLAWHILTGK